MRKCAKCGRSRPLYAFGRNARDGIGGVSRICKDCRARHERDWYAERRRREENRAARERFVRCQLPRAAASLAEERSSFAQPPCSALVFVGHEHEHALEVHGLELAPGMFGAEVLS